MKLKKSGLSKPAEKILNSKIMKRGLGKAVKRTGIKLFGKAGGKAVTKVSTALTKLGSVVSKILGPLSAVAGVAMAVYDGFKAV